MKRQLPIITQLIVLVILFAIAQNARGQICPSPTCNQANCGGVFVSYAPSGSSNVFCEGGTVTLDNTTDTNYGIQEFQIDWGDGTPIQIVNSYESISHTYNYPGLDPCSIPAGFFIQQICYIGKKICPEGQSCNWGSTVVSIKLKPKANFTLAQQVCITNPIAFTEQACHENSYLWNFGDGQTDTLANSSHTYASIGTYNVSLTVTNECGSDTKSQTVTVVPDPMSAFAQTPTSGTGCNPLTMSFDNNANLQYCTTVWSITPNNPAAWHFADTSMHVTSENITVIFTQPGIYTVSLTASNACGNDIATSIITVLNVPTITVPNIPDQCQTSFTYIPSATVTGTDTVIWQFPGGNPSSGTGTSPGAVTYSSAGTYTVMASVSNDCDTIYSTQEFIMVDPNNGPTFAPLTFCSDTPAFSLDTEVMNGEWSGTGVNGSDMFSPSTAGAGTYTLTYTQQISTCNVESDLTVTVLPLPTVNAGNDQTVCTQSAAFTLNATPAGGTWSGNGVSPNGLFNPEQAGVGNFTLTYTYTDDCTNADNVQITVQEVAVNIADNETNFCNTTTAIQLSATPSGGTWSGNGVQANGLFTPANAGVGSTELIYAYSNSNGCSDADTLTVTVVEIDSVNAGNDLSVCQNAAPLALIGFSPAGGTFSGVGVSGNTFNPALAPVGNNTITYSIGSGSCLVTDTKTITVLPVPNVSAGSNQGICLNEGSITLNGTPTGGTWSGDNVSAQGIFIPTNAGDFPVTYTVTNQEGCTNSSTVNVYVEGIPPFSFAVNDTVCIGDPLIFNIAGGSGTVCFWDYGDGTTSDVCNEVHTYTTSGTYTITLTVQTPLGCTDSISQNIFVTAPPIAAFLHDADNTTFICTPLAVNIQNQSNLFGTNATFIYDWGNGDNPLVTNNPDTLVQHTYAGNYIVSDTTFYITLTVVNPCGTATYIDSVRVAPTPQVTFGPLLDSTCSGTPILFNPNIIGNPDSYEIIWGDGSPNYNGTETDILSHIFYAYENDTVYTVCLSATNECGTDTQCWDITVHPNEVVSFFYTSILSGCSPLTVNFQDFSTDNTAPPSPGWNFGDGNVATGDSVTHTFVDSGTYTISNYASNGCAYDTSTVTITVLPAPIITALNVDPIVCVEAAVAFSATANVPIAGIIWDFGDGTPIDLTTNPSHQYQQSGTYTVSVTVISANNQCSTVQTTSIMVIERPEASFTGNFTGCSPFSFIPENTTTGGTYQAWYFNDGNTSAEVNPQHLYAVETDSVFAAMLISYNDIGCADTAYNNITVYAQPKVDFVVSDSTHCQIPATVTFTNTSQNAIGYWWDMGNGQTTTNNNPSYTYEQNNAYTVTLIGENIYGCKDTAQHVVLVVPQPIAIAQIPSGVACVPYGLVPINNSIDATDYLWFASTGEIDSTFQPNFYYTEAGTYSLTLIATNQGICPDTAYASLSIYPSPTANFTYTEILDPMPQGLVQLEDQSYDNIIAWLWDFSGQDTSNLQNPQYRFLNKNNQAIKLIVTNNFGCTDTIVKQIVVQLTPRLFFPNAFTPETGIGDERLFLPKGVCLQEYDVWVYDKWGGEVWHSDLLKDGQPAEGWDGIFRGNLLPQGSYVWKARAIFANGTIWEGKEYGNKSATTGTVTLIR